DGITWTSYGDAKAVVYSSATPHSYTITSDSYTPARAGTYYFRAVFTGDSNYAGSRSGDTEEALVVTS
ncbi:MAG: hypothetical protein NTU41_01450, partial [Chloroflexi bacterium]|nr:hypothetical protein [Chloroflexota bacterium]